MEQILEIQGLTVHYHSDGQVVRAINDLSLSLGQGEVLGLVGETGAGKTTLALSTLDMVQAAQGEVVSGTIRFQGRDVRTMSRKDIQAIRGKEIAMIFQDPMTSLNPLITVGEQIAETVRQHEQCTREQSWARAAEILELVGIPADRAEEYPYQFSGGMKQRVVIAVALACNPKLLLADEPTTALDVTIQAQVLEMMNTLIRERGTSVLFITHDLGIVAENCAKVATMYAGEVVEFGTVEQVFGAPGHPYTVGLFNSLPDFDTDAVSGPCPDTAWGSKGGVERAARAEGSPRPARPGRLKPIPGLMPDPTRLPEGCFFSPRCPLATDLCRSTHPVDAVTDGHRVKCHYPNAEKEAHP